MKKGTNCACFLFSKVLKSNTKRISIVFLPAKYFAFFFVLVIQCRNWKSIENFDEMQPLQTQKVSYHAKTCHHSLYINSKKSFVGKITWGKNMFFLNIPKSKHQMEIKIKTRYQPLTEVFDLKLSPHLTRSVSRMKW